MSRDFHPLFLQRGRAMGRAEGWRPRSGGDGDGPADPPSTRPRDGTRGRGVAPVDDLALHAPSTRPRDGTRGRRKPSTPSPPASWPFNEAARWAARKGRPSRRLRRRRHQPSTRPRDGTRGRDGGRVRGPGGAGGFNEAARWDARKAATPFGTRGSRPCFNEAARWDARKGGAPRAAHPRTNGLQRGRAMGRAEGAVDWPAQLRNALGFNEAARWDARKVATTAAAVLRQVPASTRPRDGTRGRASAPAASEGRREASMRPRDGTRGRRMVDLHKVANHNELQ